MKVILRKEAKAQGLVRYFTGVPCRNGHAVERLVSSSNCTACSGAKWSAWSVKHRAADKARKKAWYVLNCARVRAKVKKYGKDVRNGHRRKANSTVEGRAAHIHKMMCSRAKQQRYVCDVPLVWVEAEIRKGVATKIMRLDGARSPWIPSIDQITAGVGYLEGNVQIVPLWYNLAKLHFDEIELHGAIFNWFTHWARLD